MIGIGQVGVGYWGWNLLRAFQEIPEARIVGVCDQKSDVLDRAQSKYPGLRVFSAFDELLDSDELDAVVVASDTPQHFSMAKKALLAGKHVFVEKPMTETRDEAEELSRLSKDLGLHVMVGHILLYHPAYIYLEDLIGSGSLGDLYYLYSVRVNLGIVRTKENAFESLAPHDIAVAIQLTGSRPAAVSATGAAYLQRAVQDVCFATIHFENGVLAHLHCSWLDPNKVRRLTVVGSKRMAVIDDQESREKVRLYDGDITVRPATEGYADFAGSISVQSGDILAPRIPKTEPLIAECRHFLDCVATGSTPKSDVRSGLEVVRVLQAARESLDSNGATIEL